MLDAFQLFGFHLSCFVEQNQVTELNLLDDEVLNVLFIDVLAGQAVATGKLVLQAQRIHYRRHTVQSELAIFGKLSTHARNAAEGLRNGLGLTDATGFNHDVVELLHLHQVIYLLYQIHLQCAADAAVLKRHQAVIFLIHDTSLLNQVCIDVHFAQVVDDDGEANALFVAQDMVDQGGLSAAQVTRQQQYRNLFFFHLFIVFCQNCQ